MSLLKELLSSSSSSFFFGGLIETKEREEMVLCNKHHPVLERNRNKSKEGDQKNLISTQTDHTLNSKKKKRRNSEIV